MKSTLEAIIEQFIDYLMPDLTPYESTLYMYLLRHTWLYKGSDSLRIGKRTIAEGYGKGSRGLKTNYAHVTKVLKSLEEKSCITIGDVNRIGTLYIVKLPKDIPIVREKMAINSPLSNNIDYYTNPDKRHVIFERDKWVCQYCGEPVTKDNATLDHYIPQSKGGSNNADNLRTCCILCNSLKSGKTYEEAAPLLLGHIKENKVRLNT